MSVLLEQKLTVDDLKRILVSYEKYYVNETYCECQLLTGVVKCPHEDMNCVTHSIKSYLQAFRNGEISFEESGENE